MRTGATVRRRYFVFAGLSILAGVMVWFAWLYFQEYDIARVDEAARRVSADDDALRTLRQLAGLHGYVDHNASGVLHFYGTMYWAMTQNPKPFLEFAKNGNAREKGFVARISRDGKNYYEEWYGLEKLNGGR